jgi:hypothetical protein
MCKALDAERLAESDRGRASFIVDDRDVAGRALLVSVGLSRRQRRNRFNRNWGNL